MKVIRNILIAIILIAIIIWAAFGPGLRIYLSRNGSSITAEIERRSGDHIRIGSLAGDLWSGITAERVVIYADKDPAHLPLLSADRIICHLALLSLLRKDLTPASVHVDGFNAVLHVAADGEIALPEWQIQTAGGTSDILHAGFSIAGGVRKAIAITCENGVLEIHKQFPMLTESVDVEFTQLEGGGEFVVDEGLRIDEIKGKYLVTDVTLHGYVPVDEDEPVDIRASIGDVKMTSLFRDIDPLFRGNAYLPTGTASGNMTIGGSREHLEIGGDLRLSEATVAKVQVDIATAHAAYSAGVVDLTQVSLEAYGGTAAATGRINLLTDDPLWSIVGTFNEMDLPSYLNSNGYYSYEVSGGFSGTIEARGDFSNADNLACEISIECPEGTFLTPFSDRFISRTQRITDVVPITDDDLGVFDELAVDARIRHSSIIVERFHFVSNDLQVEAAGQIGFDKSISARGGLSVPLDKARQHPRFGSFAGFLPDSMNRVSLEFSLSGYLYDLDYDAELADNLLNWLLDEGSDLAHDLGDSFTGFDFN